MIIIIIHDLTLGHPMWPTSSVLASSILSSLCRMTRQTSIDIDELPPTKASTQPSLLYDLRCHNTKPAQPEGDTTGRRTCRCRKHWRVNGSSMSRRRVGSSSRSHHSSACPPHRCTQRHRAAACTRCQCRLWHANQRGYGSAAVLTGRYI